MSLAQWLCVCGVAACSAICVSIVFYWRLERTKFSLSVVEKDLHRVGHMIFETFAKLHALQKSTDELAREVEKLVGQLAEEGVVEDETEGGTLDELKGATGEALSKLLHDFDAHPPRLSGEEVEYIVESVMEDLGGEMMLTREEVREMLDEVLVETFPEQYAQGRGDKA